jgi:DNA (cytosine-5)-methyltransferase 1
MGRPGPLGPEGIVSADLGLCAGPGGWAVAAARLGIREAGIELDPAACATRRAAGHLTIRADIAAFPAGQLAGKIRGLIGSPPCGTFSKAGDQAGNAILDLLTGLIADQFAGRNPRPSRRAAMAALLAASDWAADAEPGKRAAKITAAVSSASLVAEPARYIRACRPEWIALEQVPSVLPLWRAYAAELDALGYSTWAGKLDAVDYGVPQKRLRAVLIASRARQVGRPEPTHYDPARGDQLWGERWVTMYEALGWGATTRPSVTVTAGGTATGGAEPFGHAARDILLAERDAGRWVLRTSFGRPARGRKASGSGSHGSHEMDPRARPAHTVTGKAKDWVLARPGHQDAQPTVRDVAILQSFPPDYPWQGTKTAQFRQAGDAVPPLLGEHVLAMAAGITRRAAAA